MLKKEPKKICWIEHAILQADLSKESAAEFEQQLKFDAFDCEARARLIGHYNRNEHKSKLARKKKIEHALWTLEHVPECGLGNTPLLRISKNENPKEFEQAKRIVLRHCEGYKNDSETLANLACFFQYDEPDIAERFLRDAMRISETPAQIAFWLASTLHHNGMQTHNIGKLREAVEYMGQYIAIERNFAPPRFFLIEMTFDANLFDEAAELSNSSLKNSNEDQETIHVAHTILGRIALKQNNLQAAVTHLRSAGKVGTGCRLFSYGPKMVLAKALLELGERDAVLDYLRDCKSFWELGQKSLNKWIREIRNGKNPELRGDDYEC